MPRDSTTFEPTPELPLGGAAPGEVTAQPMGSGEALLEAALAWAARGFKVFPLIREGKTPAREGWQAMATTDPEAIRQMWTEMTALDADGRTAPRIMQWNIGYLTDDLVVIDIDTKKDPDACRIYADELLGDFDTLEIRTTSGGTHLIYANGARDRSSKVNLEGLPIDIKSRGGLAVAPGSVFNGGAYAIAADRPVRPVPPHIARRIPLARERHQKTGVVLADLDKPAAVKRAKRLVAKHPPAERGGRGIACYKLAALLRDYGISVDTAKELINEGWSPRCDPPFPFEDTRDENGPIQGADATIEHAFAHAQNEAGSKSAEATLPNVVLRSAPTYSEPLTPATNVANGLSAAGRTTYFIPRTDKGAPIPVLASVAGIFRHEREFENRFAYNEFTRTPELWPERIPVDDAAIAKIVEALQLRHSMARVAFATVKSAIMMRARELPYNPVKDEFDACARDYDGQARLGTWLSRYLGTPQDEYHANVGTMWVIQMMARVYAPGCQADYIPTLVGPQGVGKSSIAAILGGKYFSDALADIKNKDASQHVSGKLILELPELSALNRASVEAVKAFATRRYELYRRPYDSMECEEPRQCTFVATTNQETPLRDSTGNRRFWPIAISKVDLAALERDRKQLFGEAVHLLRQGHPWWPDRDFERVVIAPVQEIRLDVDAWEGPTLAYLHTLARRPHTGEPPWPHPRVTLPEVALKALNITTDRLGTRETRRIAAILVRAGWRPGRTPTERFWERCEGWLESAPLPPALASVATPPPPKGGA